MFEHAQQKLLPKKKFYTRLVRNTVAAFLALILSLVVGMVGYHQCEGMSWVDAFVNASMILSGMGPVTPLSTTCGKLFAGSYALFSGVIFLISMAFIVAPIFHRFLHKFHMPAE